jgi:hypothetical protein
VIIVDNQKLICKACGSDSFTKGEMDGYAKLKPINTLFAIGSSLTYTFCKDCGEVASIKVNKPHKF